MKVLSFGEILFDIIDEQPYLGGAPLNFAGHLAKQGLSSYMFSRVGKDELGKRALHEIQQMGVNVSLIQHDESHATGTVPVVLNDGQPDYTIIENVAYDFIDYAESEHQLSANRFDVLYFGTLAQRSEAAAASLHELLKNHQFSHIFYDINLRKDCFNKAIIQHSMEHCTIFKLNDEEVNVLSEMFYGKQYRLPGFMAKLSADFDIKLILITAGAKGCYVFENNVLNFVEGFPVTVKDTVGAGDAFSAAFVKHYIKSNAPRAAAKIANQLGAFVASSSGPLPEYSADIKAILQD